MTKPVPARITPAIVSGVPSLGIGRYLLRKAAGEMFLLTGIASAVAGTTASAVVILGTSWKEKKFLLAHVSQLAKAEGGWLNASAALRLPEHGEMASRILSDIPGLYAFPLMATTIVVPAFVLFAKKAHVEAMTMKHIRGARLVSEAELIKEVHSTASEYARWAAIDDARIPPWTKFVPPLRKMLEAKATRDIKAVASPIHIGETPLPPRMELRNIAMVGVVGTGKSVAIKRILADIEKQGQRVVIYDPTGEFIQFFYDESRGDVILNPVIDARSPGWSPWNEVRNPAVDYLNLAKGLIPDAISGSGDEFWVQAAQILFMDLCEGLAKKGKTTCKDLYEAVALWDMETLSEVVLGMGAARFINEKTEKMGQSVLSTLQNSIWTMRNISPSLDPFSIRDWVERDDKSWLFLQSRADVIETVRPLIGLWIDVAITQIMLGPTDAREPKFWLCCDEAHSLGRINSLQKSLTQARKYGLAHLLGFQTVMQLEEKYSKPVADTMLTNMQTKLVLRCDGANAKYWSELIGKEEVFDPTVGLQPDNEENTGGNINQGRIERLAVMDSTISRLPDLHGFLILPGELPVAKVALKIRDYPVRAPDYVPLANDPFSGKKLVPPNIDPDTGEVLDVHEVTAAIDENEQAGAPVEATAPTVPDVKEGRLIRTDRRAVKPETTLQRQKRLAAEEAQKREAAAATLVSDATEVSGAIAHSLDSTETTDDAKPSGDLLAALMAE